MLTVHPGAGVLTVAIAGSLAYDGFEVAAGEDILVAWIRARVSEDATPGAQLTLTPTNGEEDHGVGPYRMRNEITSQGEARLVSTFPRLFGSKIIVDVDPVDML